MHNLYKHEINQSYLHPKFFAFFVSLYKVLSEFLAAPLIWGTFSACLVALVNLGEVSESSILTNFMSPIFGFSNVYGIE